MKNKVILLTIVLAMTFTGSLLFHAALGQSSVDTTYHAWYRWYAKLKATEPILCEYALNDSVGYTFAYCDSIFKYKNDIVAFRLAATTLPTYELLKAKILPLIEFPKLRILDLANVVTDSLPAEMSLFKHLEFVNMSDSYGCDWEQPISALAGVKGLTCLWLMRHNNVPTSICQLNQLEILSLQSMEIDTLPNCIGDMPNLNTLVLAGSYIKDIESVIEPLTRSQSLTTLGLQFLFLHKFPPNIGNIKNLKYLDILYNSIDTIPCSLAGKGITFEGYINERTVFPDCFK